MSQLLLSPGAHETCHVGMEAVFLISKLLEDDHTCLGS